MILIYPPATKSCEPPAGIARLSGALRHHGVNHRVWDANLEGLMTLLKSPPSSADTWTSRAFRHLPEHLASLKNWAGYQNPGRYRRAVNDLSRLLGKNPCSGRVRLGLSNYEDKELSPARSSNLLRAAEEPEENPFFPFFKSRIAELLVYEESSFIGFSVNFLSQALSAFAMIGHLKREYPDRKLALGGGLVTSWMRRPGWKNPFGGLVDYFVAGPGEGPLLSLSGVEDLKTCCHPQLPNEFYRPDFDLLPTGDYLAPGFILPYSASSGCYWSHCSFCPERAEKNPYIAVPADRVIDDLRFLVEKHQPVLIHLLDNAISPALMRALIEKPPDAPWYGFARITRHLADPDFCTALKKSGCVMLKLGLESGDQAVLDSLQKGIDLAEVSSVLRNLKKAGIATYLYLLFGTPQEGRIEAQKTLDFVVGHADEIGFLNLALFNMPIYGPEAQQAETRKFYDGDLSLYTDFDHPKDWSRQKIRQFLDKEFKRHPALAPILRRDPAVFTSNHAAFFVMDGKARSERE